MTVRGDRIGFNQATAETSSTEDLLAACRDAGIGRVSLWRHKYIGGDVRATRRAVEDHGLAVSSVCRGGFFTGTRPVREADADNRRAVEEAAELGAGVLVLVCGPAADGDIAAAEAAISAGIERLLPVARDAGVTLAVEPFHPMLAAERSAIVTLAQANRLVERFADPALGLALDTYHVWWDPDLAAGVRRAAGRIAIVHIADWLVPTTHLTHGRGLPGDGVIPLAGLLSLLDEAGYTGTVEAEVLNPEVWSRPPRQVAADVRTRMLRLLEESGAPADAARQGPRDGAPHAEQDRKSGGEQWKG